MLGVFITKFMVRRGFQQFSNHDLENFLKAWNDDASLLYPGDVPASGKIIGKDAIKKWFQNHFENAPQINFTVKNICVDNIFDFVGSNTVAVHWEVDLTSRDGFKFNNSGITFMKLKFGKVVSCKDFIFDTGPEFRKAWGIK